MKTRAFILVIVGLFLVFWLAHAIAAPRAGSAEECFYISDMALTARALTIEGVSEETTQKIIARMYKGPAAPAWYATIINGARTDKRDAGDYARALYQHCTNNRGNVDAFFGIGT